METCYFASSLLLQHLLDSYPQLEGIAPRLNAALVDVSGLNPRLLHDPAEWAAFRPHGLGHFRRRWPDSSVVEVLDHLEDLAHVWRHILSTLCPLVAHNWRRVLRPLCALFEHVWRHGIQWWFWRAHVVRTTVTRPFVLLDKW